MKRSLRIFPFLAVLCGLLGLMIGCTGGGSGNGVTPALLLDKKEAALTVGAETVLTATLEEADGAFVWTSSDEAVVTVAPDESGSSAAVKAVGTGTATVTVTVGELTAVCEVTVTASPLSIFLPAGGLVLKKNMTASVKAMSTVELEGEPVWESSDEAVGTVEYQGLTAIVKAVARGTCTITVRVDGYAASFLLTVGTSGH